LSGIFSKWFFLGLFAFWRLAYNGGIGYVLDQQSKERWFCNLVAPLMREGAPLRRFLKQQLTAAMGADYDFEVRRMAAAGIHWAQRMLNGSWPSQYWCGSCAAPQRVPMDYNCWLVFRALVDLVLLNDFFSYVVFAFAFSEAPARWTWLEVASYIGGFGLCVFNWFIKLDALRVVKDYAWCTCHSDAASATEIRSTCSQLFAPLGRTLLRMGQTGAISFSWLMAR